MSELLFVYGTLKSGESNHNILECCSPTLVSKTVESFPKFTLLDLGAYPAVIKTGNTSIHGEVYEIGDLSSIDILEGHPQFYYREQFPFILWPNHRVNCWMYTLRDYQKYVAPTQKNVIEEGNWSRHARRNRKIRI